MDLSIVTTITDHIPLTPSAAMLGRLVILAGACVLTYQMTRCTQPERAKQAAPPDTVTKKRTITKRDTVTETVPRTVIRYDTVRATDTLRVPVPADFDMMGAIPQQPLDIGSDEATLTYWTGQRWQQNIYELPDEPWALCPEVEIRTTPVGLEAAGTLSLRYRKVTLSAGYTTIAGERGFTAGLAVRPFTLTW